MKAKSKGFLTRGKGSSLKSSGLFRRQLGKRQISLCRRMLALHELCDNCLGRQFAQLGTGMTNAERGRIAREASGSKSASGRCFLCEGFFLNIGRWVDEAANKLRRYEFSSFAVGTKPGRDITQREEGLWEEAGIEHCEPFRSECNREFGKALWKAIRKDVDEEEPDMFVMLDLGKGCIELEPRSVYISGAYKKLVRGIPQTKWDMYPETVEDIIAAPFMNALGGERHSLHCAGREDIDARCLDWRRFVLEIEKPLKRKAGLKAMLTAINKTGKVMVSGLKYSDRHEVVVVKSLRQDKEYRMIVEFESTPNGERLNQLPSLAGPIKQQTPTRVMHRRADLLRHKKVKSIGWHKIRENVYEVRVRGDAGLYAKEFVNGDNGRTRPSVAGLLGVSAKELELDVVKIYKEQRSRSVRRNM